MTGRLLGKRIVITGAAQGIAQAIAGQCAREGARLFMIDQDAHLLARAARELGAEGDVGHMAADVADRGAIEDAMRAADAAIGPVNALINGAGVNVFETPLETSDDDWALCLDVNLKGAWNCCRAVLPGMIAAGGGVILNIASTHAFNIIPRTFPYPVAKHGLLGLTRSLGIEYAARGVRVNALAPGYVETQKCLDWWQSFPDPAAARARTLALHPGGRIAQPAEIAAAAVFMISDECPFINAACLTIDGGLSALQHG